MKTRSLEEGEGKWARNSLLAFLDGTQPRLETIIGVVKAHGHLAEAHQMLREMSGYGQPEKYQQLDQWFLSESQGCG